MDKKELLEKIKDLPDNTPIAIFDHEYWDYNWEFDIGIENHGGAKKIIFNPPDL